ASEKVQKTSPWKYLGWRIGMHSFLAQSLQISTEIKTIHDAQKLLGTINWVRPLLGISNADLESLFALLGGQPDLLSPRHLNAEAQAALQKVADAISQRQPARWAPELPLWLIILNPSRQPHALIFQWDSEKTEPLLIIEWVFLPNNMTKYDVMAMLIVKPRQRLTTLAGKDLDRIYLPLTTFYLNWLLQMSEKMQIALADYPGQISIHPPKHKLLSSSFNLLPKPKRSETPLRAMTIFTDGSRKTHKSVIVRRDSETGTWQSDVAVVEGSPQIVELAAVVRVFQKFSTHIYLITDSAYVSGIVHRAENSVLKNVKNNILFSWLKLLVYLLDQRTALYFVMHTRSHSNLPGFLTEGNAQADLLTLSVQHVLLNKIEQARLNHSFFHWNAGALVRIFKLTPAQACNIIAVCPDCQCYSLPNVNTGVNPRGLQSLQIWQTDVTHFPEFGHLKFVHASIDTYSGALFASAHMGEM
ncbi:POK6 protein, partial [Panurus biarmicus]|nr:POK6 protein [Panurus biarmicus]